MCIKYFNLIKPDIVLNVTAFNDMYFFLQYNGKLYNHLNQEYVIKYLYSSDIIRIINKIMNNISIYSTIKSILSTSYEIEENNNYTVW